MLSHASIKQRISSFNLIPMKKPGKLGGEQNKGPLARARSLGRGLPGLPHPWIFRVHEGHLHEVFTDEPRLQFVPAQDVTHH
jgi:hypothetical protein